VIVASGSDAVRWAPLDRDRHRVLAHQIACRPCGYMDCPIGHPCAEAITVADVLVQAATLLEKDHVLAHER
jgi:hypothetical protein